MGTNPQRTQGQIKGIDHATLMDRVYKRQRHFYDATRKYYLLGRDPMIGTKLASRRQCA